MPEGFNFWDVGRDPAESAASRIFGGEPLVNEPLRCELRGNRLVCPNAGVEQLAARIFNGMSEEIEDVPGIGWVWSTLLSWASDRAKRRRLERLAWAYERARSTLKERAWDFRSALITDWLSARGYAPLLELLASAEWLFLFETPEATLARSDLQITAAERDFAAASLEGDAALEGAGFAGISEQVLRSFPRLQRWFQWGGAVPWAVVYAESGAGAGVQPSAAGYYKVMGNPRAIELPWEVQTQIDLACSVHPVSDGLTQQCRDALHDAIGTAVIFAANGGPLEPRAMIEALESRFALEVAELRRRGEMHNFGSIAGVVSAAGRGYLARTAREAVAKVPKPRSSSPTRAGSGLVVPLVVGGAAAAFFLFRR